MTRIVGPIETPSLLVNPPRWDDLRIPLSASRGAGVNDPTFALFKNDGAGSTGVFSWSFSNAVIQELFFVAQLPHHYKLGSDLLPHVHWSPSDAGAGNVVWGLEYTLANAGIPSVTFFPNTLLVSGTQAAAGIAFQHQKVKLTTIPGTGVRVSTLIIGRLFRNTVGNTYAAAAFAHEIDFHYQIDNLGSNLETTKTDSGGV